MVLIQRILIKFNTLTGRKVSIQETFTLKLMTSKLETILLSLRWTGLKKVGLPRTHIH
jgi:hypothetical protein